MIGREKRVLLRHYLEQGMSKAAIARDLGISRRTVLPLDQDGPARPGVGRRTGRLRSEACDVVEAGPIQAVNRRSSQ